MASYLKGFLVFLSLCAPTLAGALEVTNEPSKFRSAEDGCLDVSGFLEQKYGFLPIIMPITEPAVGYGAAGGLMFLSKPLPQVEDGLGQPNITIAGGLATANGTWGVLAGDMRYWLDDRLQSLIGFIYTSVNLDFYGLGSDPLLGDHPLRYNLEPKGGMLRLKYRLGDSRVWAGLNYAFASTGVAFAKPPGTPGEPAIPSESKVGGFTPSLTLDTRDNFFTPTRGTYIEASAGLFSPAFGGDTDFQRASLIAMQYFPLGSRLFLGVRADGAASFGDVPFYLRPFISLRGAPTLRYQGEEVAQIETELRWQFWRRFSVVGFTGGGATWNHFERFERSQTVVTGGAGLRYEIARAYGIHMGLDFAFAPHNNAVYVQIGSAWARP